LAGRGLPASRALVCERSPRSFARAATGLSPVRANATARWRNSAGCGAGIDDILPGSHRPPHPGVRRTGGSSPS